MQPPGQRPYVAATVQERAEDVDDAVRRIRERLRQVTTRRAVTVAELEALATLAEQAAWQARGLVSLCNRSVVIERICDNARRGHLAKTTVQQMRDLDMWPDDRDAA